MLSFFELYKIYFVQSFEFGKLYMWLWKCWIILTSWSIVSVSLNSTLDCSLFLPFVSVDARSIKNTRPIRPGILVNMIGLSSKSELVKTCHFGLLFKAKMTMCCTKFNNPNSITCSSVTVSCMKALGYHQKERLSSWGARTCHRSYRYLCYGKHLNAQKDD